MSNAAQRLYESIGVPTQAEAKQAHGDRNAKASKAGPGRYHSGGEPGNRIGKDRPVRAYKALLAAWAARLQPTSMHQRDEHGAYTLVGKDWQGEKRMWLAGISAQRGY